MLTGNRLDTWTSAFIGTTVATSSTGFGFPFDHLLPSHIVGIISLVVMAIAIVARYGYRMAGGWRSRYVIAAVAGLYFNVFVLVVQLFQKLPALKAVAPTPVRAAVRGHATAGACGVRLPRHSRSTRLPRTGDSRGPCLDMSWIPLKALLGVLGGLRVLNSHLFVA